MTLLANGLPQQNPPRIREHAKLKACLELGDRATLPGPLRSPVAITLAADTVYFGTTDSIFRLPKSGGQPSLLADHQGRPSSLRVDGEHLYFTNYFDGSIMRLALAAGSEPVVLARGQNYAGDLVVDGQKLYWVARDGVGLGSVLTLSK